MFKPISEIPRGQMSCIHKSGVPAYIDQRKVDRRVPFFFRNYFSPASAEDLVWLEAAAPAIGVFVQEAARMGGGGRVHNDGDIEGSQPLSMMQVLGSLVDPEKDGDYFATGPNEPKNLFREFPCVQSISSYFGSIEVRISVILTQTALAQAQEKSAEFLRKLTRDNGVAQQPVDLPAHTSRVCVTCFKTDSDMRSRGATGLFLCACRADGVRYWYVYDTVN
jgi:hypothetical protein